MQPTPRKSVVSRFYVILVAGVLGMGMSMPSCPGEQALQQQVDTLTAQNAELNKKIQGLNPQVQGLNKDMADVKTLLKAMADTVQAQKTALDQLDASVKELQSKVASAKAPARGGKPAAKKHR